MKRFLIWILCSGFGGAVTAQQLQTSSMYDLQGVFHNASTAGVNGSMVGASYRTQWSGISGTPRTATIFGSFDLPQSQIGLGAYLYNDKTGPTSRSGAALQFAKHIKTGNDGVFSLGIEGRVQQYAIDKSKLTDALGSDPLLAGGDTKFMFDAGFGISYTNKKLQLGAAVAQLVQSKLDLYTGNTNRTEEGRLYRHYYFHGSYQLVNDGMTTVTPNALVIYMPNAPTEYQFGARVEHKETIFWGVSYRLHQSWMLSAGVKVNKKFMIGYSYDIYQTPLSVYDQGGGAHELLLRYQFRNKQ